MSWDAAMTAEQAVKQIRKDHGIHLGRMERAAFNSSRLSFGVSYQQGYLRAVDDVLTWILHMQETEPNFPTSALKETEE